MKKVLSAIFGLFLLGITFSPALASTSSSGHAFQVLAINYFSLSLIFLGIGFLLAEIFVVSYGILAIGGIIALAIGSLLLLESNATGFQITWQLILAVSIVSAVFCALIIGFAIRVRKRRVVTGREQLLDSIGVVEIDKQGMLRIRVQGELWQVRSQSPLYAQQQVKVIGMDGLILLVTPLMKSH